MSTDKFTQDLVSHFLAKNTPEQMEAALRALLTPAELAEISRRVQIFRLLREGVPQRQIAERLGVGIATVSRGARAMKLEQSE